MIVELTDRDAGRIIRLLLEERRKACQRDRIDIDATIEAFPWKEPVVLKIDGMLWRIEDLVKHVSWLSEREKSVLLAIYSGKTRKTLRDAGFRLGISAERVRQIRVRAFRKIMHPLHLASLHNIKEILDEKRNDRS